MLLVLLPILLKAWMYHLSFNCAAAAGRPLQILSHPVDIATMVDIEQGSPSRLDHSLALELDRDCERLAVIVGVA